MSQRQLPNAFLRYLAENPAAANGLSEDECRLPPLTDLSKELGVSVSYLREQLEVAKAIGLVEVRPRTGMRRLPYTFFPAVRQSLAYAVALDRQHFWEYSDLRIHIEGAYWKEAVSKLIEEDHKVLNSLLAEAWLKLRGHPVEIPHLEHRRLHLTIYSRLGNPFVSGLLEAYWDLYEAVGLNLYADLDYLELVWAYHQKMVDSICSGDIDRGYQALLDHRDLLLQRHSPNNKQADSH